MLISYFITEQILIFLTILCKVDKLYDYKIQIIQEMINSPKNSYLNKRILEISK